MYSIDGVTHPCDLESPVDFSLCEYFPQKQGLCGLSSISVFFALLICFHLQMHDVFLKFSFCD